MKLKLLKKKDSFSATDPLIIHVEYGDKEGPKGEKLAKKKFIEKVAIGQTIDVEDQLGYRILDEYGSCFQQVFEKSTKEVPIGEIKTK